MEQMIFPLREKNKKWDVVFPSNIGRLKGIHLEMMASALFLRERETERARALSWGVCCPTLPTGALAVWAEPLFISPPS